MKKTAVIYGRVSSAGQAEEELPIDGQLEACRREAQQLDAAVLREFVDAGISGRTVDHRPAFMEAIAFCKANQVDLFITWSTSRFARNRVEAPAYKLKLKKFGTNVVFVSNKFDNSTKEGWMMEGILELWDDFQSRTIAEDTLRSMRKNAQDGFFNGGPVPFGYTPVPAGKRRKLQVVEHEADTVREVFQLYLSGNGLKAIAVQLNARGRMRRGSPWTKGLVNRTLKNWVYAGYIVFNQYTLRPNAEVIKTAGHPAIIEESVFMTVQKLMAARTPLSGEGSPKSTYLFTGLLKCGCCGQSMMIETATGRSKTYSYYNCSGSIKGGTCSPRRIPAREFDAWMADYIIGRVMTIDNLRGIAGEVRQAAIDWGKTRGLKRASLVADLRDIEARRRRLYNLMETTDKGALNLRDIGPRLHELNDSARKIEAELNNLEMIEPPEVKVSDAELQAVQDFVRSVVMESNNPKKVREFMGSFVEKITLNPDAAIVKYRADRLVTNTDTDTVQSEKWWGATSGILRTATIIAILPDRFRKAA